MVCGGVRHPEALLEPTERCLLPVVRDDLAVQEDVPSPLGGHRRSDLGVGAGEVPTGARLQPHLAAVAARDAALAVELALEQPVVTELATVGQRRQHQSDRHARIVPWRGRERKR